MCILYRFKIQLQHVMCIHMINSMICINTYTCVWFLIEPTKDIYNFETMISLKYMAGERVCVCFMFYRERESLCSSTVYET